MRIFTNCPKNGEVTVKKVVRESNIIDLASIKEIFLHGGGASIKAALEILSYKKDYYSEQDIKDLEELFDLIGTTFKPTVTYRSRKTLLSKEKEVWKCACNYDNDMSVATCLNCQRDQYGFRISEVKPKTVAALIADRLAVLKGLQ